MKLFDWLTRKSGAQQTPAAVGSSHHLSAYNIEDPRFLEQLRKDIMGVTVTVDTAMKNPAVLRSVNLITNSIAMLPWVPKVKDSGGVITPQPDHPLARVLMVRPNQWQTPFKFKRQMMNWVLVHGNAYALIVRGFGNRITALVPLEPGRCTVRQRADWTVEYQVSDLQGGSTIYEPDDIFHLSSQSSDGLTGLSRVQLAADVISNHISLNRASRRLFDNGMMVNGFFKMPQGKELSQEAYDRLKNTLSDKYEGPDNAGKTPILEDGLDYQGISSTAREGQMNEQSDRLKQEIGMVFDVPRPFLFLDDTSWGSGIEQLKIMLHSGALSPWFSCIEDEANLKCLSDQERGQGMFVDIDERELLRGTLKDQAEFYAKAMGSGGGYGWMNQNEVRGDVGLSPTEDGTTLPKPIGGQNEPQEAA